EGPADLVAGKLVFFDQSDPTSALGERRRSCGTGRARADDNDVVGPVFTLHFRIGSPAAGKETPFSPVRPAGRFARSLERLRACRPGAPRPDHREGRPAFRTSGGRQPPRKEEGRGGGERRASQSSAGPPGRLPR